MSNKIYRLFLAHIPKHLETEDLQKILSKHNIDGFIYQSKNSIYKFANFYSQKDMEKAARGLIEYGIKAEVSYFTKRCYENESESWSSSSETSKPTCVHCYKTANFKCQKCGDFYCSTVCQQKDWKSHRYICKKLPILIPLNDNEDHKEESRDFASDTNNSFDSNVIEYGKDSPKDEKENLKLSNELNCNDKEVKLNEGKINLANPPKNGSQIIITYCLDINVLYIISSQEEKEYFSDLKQIDIESKKSKLLETLPAKDDLVAALYNKEYYRALVWENVISEDNINILYIDFGKVEIKKLSDLKVLPPNLIKFKVRALPIILKDIPNVEDELKKKEILDYLNSFVKSRENRLSIIYGDIFIKGNPVVEIMDIKENKSLNKHILDLINNPVKKTFKTRKDIDFIKFKNGENVIVITFDNSFLSKGLVSCILPAEANIIIDLCEKLENCVKNDNVPYKPEVSELCLVQFEDDDCWYRAECLSHIDEENCSVLFFDFGNESASHINKIRKYPEEFLEIPCYTNLCLIADLPINKLNNSTIEKMQSLIPSNEKMKVKKIEIQKDNVIIYLPNLIEQLKAEKFF